MDEIEFIYTLFQKHPKVITDSRKIEKGCLFFALKGDRFNGNEYAQEAILKGASYAIIDEEKYKKSDETVLVDDVLLTLQKLATFHRRRMIIPIIAITGSNGKTTTKELISVVLNSQYNCHFTKGNLNNHIGVPLTLLELTPEHEVAIIEMGANHVGEIDFLCKITEPTHGIITNIGKAHLEGFGGIEGVKKGKSELYKFIQWQNGVAFVNMNESFLSELSEGITKRVFYKESKNPDPLEAPYETTLFQESPFVKIGFLDNNQELISIQSQLIGLYNFNNIMTAASIGRYFRVRPKRIKEAIENYIPSNNRSQLVEKSTNTYILDAYNANPTSMKNALVNFGQIDANRKVAILGDMLELGKYSDEEHLKIAQQAIELKLDQVVLVGEEFLKVKIEGVQHYEDVNDLKESFAKKDFQNTHFLIKGSRGIKLEEFLS
ncbi:MAG: UDP-N-acetylmuramoyl-tripeptide--D-alanyl-D-alanine ligase [Saprospiraceae bacterium]